MQHVNIKVFAAKAEDVNLAAAIPVFHRWIQDRALPELLIDVADYSHVPAGPGVLLIAHEANYSLDNGRNRLGLLYNRKAASDGGAQQSLRQAYQAALAACERLEQEPEFQNKLQFDPGDVELTLNDRLLHPNTEEDWQSIQSDVANFFDNAFGKGAYAFERTTDPRERLQLRVRKSG
jgi:hypothetical protein